MDLGISFEDIAKEFREESLELLDEMERSLLQIQESGMDDESINAVFRAAHTIKGVSGMYKIDYVVEFTHVAENLLDQIRNGKVAMSDELNSLLLECKDHMQNLVEYAYATLNKEPLSDGLKETTNHLIDSLSANIDGAKASIASVATKKEEERIEHSYLLKLKFEPTVLEQGFDPASFLSYLRKHSSSFKVFIDASNVPNLSDLDPTLLYLTFDVDVTTNLTKDEVLDIFEFVKDGSEIVLQEIQNKVDTQTVLPDDKNNDLDTSLDIKESQSVAPKEIKSPSSLTKNTQNPTTSATTSYSIRVDAEKIDKLINLIGELVIANANVVQQSMDLKNQELIESVSIVSRMLEDVRESAMQIRMVQIGETFNKFKRIVLDLAKKLGKDVELTISGGDTELDKTVIEKINDPLVHIIRNAIDHGIETPEVRQSKRKNPKGTLSISAYHDAGTVVIEIKDDGKGLDEEVIKAKAIEKGIIEEGANLTQKQIFELILQPGFSTAPAITDLSGRGVGMDVVKRNIESLRGNIEIQSRLNEGTTFIIRLPLTLAIIDGFLVKVGETFYVLPLDMVVECIELSESYKKNMHGNNYINLRGSVLPLLNVSSYFGEKKIDTKRENVVVVQCGGRRFGFIVDELYGEFQTVIKPLGVVFSNLKGISGATILGSGSVALILDVPSIGAHVASIKSHKENSI